MQDFGTKADNSPPPGGQLSATEFNNLATENENAVLRSGQALSGASDTQLAQSLFLHGVKSESFQDSGAANAYVATPVSGASGVLLPNSYTNLNGATIAFKAANANTTAATLNIGQTTGTLLGAKAIRTQADTAIPAGSIGAGVYLQLTYNPAFDSGNGAWVLMPWASANLLTTAFSNTAVYRRSGGVQQVSVNGAAFTVTGATTFIYPASGVVRKRVWGAGGGGGGVSGASAAGSGGNGGGYSEGIFKAAPGTSESVTIGSGGAGGVGANNGATGGSTTAGTVVCTGGGGGIGTNSGTVPANTATFGTGSGGQFNVPGSGASGSFQASGFIASGGGGAFCTPPGPNTTGLGATGNFPGGAGGGGTNISNGGVGADGCAIYEY